jgi:hypothetical protein
MDSQSPADGDAVDDDTPDDDTPGPPPGTSKIYATPAEKRKRKRANRKEREMQQVVAAAAAAAASLQPQQLQQPQQQLHPALHPYWGMPPPLGHPYWGAPHGHPMHWLSQPYHLSIVFITIAILETTMNSLEQPIEANL